MRRVFIHTSASVGLPPTACSPAGCKITKGNHPRAMQYCKADVVPCARTCVYQCVRFDLVKTIETFKTDMLIFVKLCRLVDHCERMNPIGFGGQGYMKCRGAWGCNAFCCPYLKLHSFDCPLLPACLPSGMKDAENDIGVPRTLCFGFGMGTWVRSKVRASSHVNVTIDVSGFIITCMLKTRR